MQSAISSGLRSVDAGVSRLDNAAARIARDGADGDLVSRNRDWCHKFWRAAPGSQGAKSELIGPK